MAKLDPSTLAWPPTDNEETLEWRQAFDASILTLVPTLRDGPFSLLAHAHDDNAITPRDRAVAATRLTAALHDLRTYVAKGALEELLVTMQDDDAMTDATMADLDSLPTTD